MNSGCWVDGWLDVTPPTCMYEVGFHPATLKYRHRLRRLFPSSDPSIIIVRCISAGEWFDGPPPPYPS